MTEKTTTESVAETLVQQPTRDQIDKWKADNPNGVFSWDLEEVGTLVWKTASQAVWRMFIDASSDADQPRSEVLTNLVNGCMLHPSGTELSSLLRNRPQLLGALASHIQRTGAEKQKKEPTRL